MRILIIGGGSNIVNTEIVAIISKQINFGEIEVITKDKHQQQFEREQPIYIRQLLIKEEPFIEAKIPKRINNSYHKKYQPKLNKNKTKKR